jgi:Cryptococcal mannosyltransferase 1
MLRARSLFKLAIIVFINNLIRCADDLLKILYQQAKLRADINCAINWVHNGISYYDIWAAQGIRLFERYRHL